MDKLAADLCAAWRNAQDLAPVPWQALDAREQAIWLTVAAAVPKPKAAK